MDADEDSRKVGSDPTPAGPDSIWHEDEGGPPTGSDADSPGTIWGSPAEQVETQTQRVRVRVRERRKRKRGKARLVATVATVVVVALLGDLAYVGYGLVTSLTAAQDDLQAARASLSDGEIAAAGGHFEDAREHSREAVSLTSHPGFLALTPLPDTRAIDGIAEAALLASDAGTEGLQAAQTLGTTGEEVSEAIFSDGVLNIEAMREVQPHLRRAASLLEEAVVTLGGDETPLLDVIADLRDDALREVSEAADSTGTAGKLLGVLPSIFGAEGDRTYLLAFQALGEARATGGLVGLHGSLETSSGRISLGEPASLTETFPTRLDEPVDASPWFEENYGPQSALVEPQQANTSPNFPEVARVLMEMFGRKTNARYDGVFMMDPVALQSLMKGMEPIEVKGFDRSVDSSNVVDVLLRDSYVELTQEEQNVFLGGVIDEFWGRVAAGEFDAAAFTTGLNEAVDTGHVKIYMSNADEAAAIDSAEADGDFTDGGANVQLVFHNNYSANKVDYFVRRNIHTAVRLKKDGAAEVETTIEIQNTAPDGPPSALLGPSQVFTPDDPPGMNRMFFNVLLPESAVVSSWEQDGTELDTEVYEDAGYPVSWDQMEIPAGESSTVRVRYVLNDAYREEDSGVAFDFTLFPQPTVVPDEYRLTVAPPLGYVFDRDGEHRESFESRGNLSRPVRISLDIVPAF